MYLKNELLNLFNQIELIGRKINYYDIPESIVSSFLNYLDINLEELPNSKTWYEILCTLLNIYDKNTCEGKLLYNLLEDNNYRKEESIISAIGDLTSMDSENINASTIRRVISSKYINDIDYSNKVFTLYSEVGDISFRKFSNECNNRIRQYIRNNTYNNDCHNHSLFLSKVDSSFNSVTSLCKGMFTGEYFHSYALNSGEVIDLNIDAIMNEDLYNTLFSPTKITVLSGSIIEEEYKNIIRKTHFNKEYYPLVTIALYYLYKQNRGECSPYVRVLK